ncbi:MAG: type II toxin-antitoxin system RelE/ParE family toxin [bacterium]|nr:type II toxin-antitoxin system RelE/ParE family toxin [bacterium]
MPRILKTPLALEDTLEAAEFIYRDNPQAAERFLDLIDEKLKLLAENPLIGRERAELLASLRSFPFKSYVVFYRPLTDGIEFIRLLHAHQDVEGRFGGAEQ